MEYKGLASWSLKYLYLLKYKEYIADIHMYANINGELRFNQIDGTFIEHVIIPARRYTIIPYSTVYIQGLDFAELFKTYEGNDYEGWIDTLGTPIQHFALFLIDREKQTVTLIDINASDIREHMKRAFGSVLPGYTYHVLDTNETRQELIRTNIHEEDGPCIPVSFLLLKEILEPEYTFKGWKDIHESVNQLLLPWETSSWVQMLHDRDFRNQLISQIIQE